jgi:TatD DNase family protein
MNLSDAHTHYHFPFLAPSRESVGPVVRAAGVTAAVVNGTEEEDWPLVAEFVRQQAWCRAAYGIHPWQAPRRSAGWEAELRLRLESDPRASVGEIGLDAWVEGHDLKDQSDLFLRQWDPAASYARPVMVHCVRAWRELRAALKPLHPSAGGFLIHACNGLPEWIPWFAGKGAYFSFSPYFCFVKLPMGRTVVCRGWFSAAFVFGPSVFYPV